MDPQGQKTLEDMTEQDAGTLCHNVNLNKHMWCCQPSPVGQVLCMCVYACIHVCGEPDRHHHPQSYVVDQMSNFSCYDLC